MSKFKEYLKSIGVDAKTITAIEKAEEKNEDIDLKPLVDDFNAGQRKLFENDGDLVGAIGAKEKGKLLDIWTRAVKKEFGLDAAAIKDKTLEEVIKIAKTESTKGMDKSLQEVQAELTEANAKLKELHEVEIPKIKSEVESEKKNFKISNKLKKLIPVADLRVPEETVEMVLMSQLGSKYDLDLDDAEEVAAFIKGKRLQPKSADGTKLLTINDIVTDILKTNKFIKESNAEDTSGTPSKKPVTVTDPNATNKKELAAKLPHLAEAMRHADELKKRKEARGQTA